MCAPQGRGQASPEMPPRHSGALLPPSSLRPSTVRLAQVRLACSISISRLLQGTSPLRCLW